MAGFVVNDHINFEMQLIWAIEVVLNLSPLLMNVYITGAYERFKMHS